MPVSINTSDALYSSILELFGVDDDNTVKGFRYSPSLTTNASVRRPTTVPASGSSPYGRAFGPTGSADGTTINGVTVPTMSINTNSALSVFIAHNGYVSSSTNSSGTLMRPAFGNTTVSNLIAPGFQVNPATGKFLVSSNNGMVGIAGSASQQSAGSVLSAGSFAFSRNGTNPIKMWINGSRDANATGSGMTFVGGTHGFAGSSELGFIGGFQAWVGFDYVWVALFNVELSDADVTRLHNSLGAGNAFALIESPPADLSGNVTLDAVAPAGTLADGGSSGVSGNVTLDAVAPAGTLGATPAAYLIPALTNWAGSVQAGVTVAVVTFQRLSDGVQVLALTGQVTNGSGNLSGSNGALSAGTTYMATGWNADGSQRFAVPITAT